MTGPTFRCHRYEFELIGDPATVELLAALLADLRVAATSSPHVWRVETYDRHVRIVVDHTEVGRWTLDDHLPTQVVAAVNMAAISAEPSQLHVHAGAVVAAGSTILLAAPSGSGKTTLTCALVAAGAEYRSDEFAAVDRDGTIHTAPKPVSVKAAGIAAVERLTGIPCPHAGRSWYVPVSSFGRVAATESPVTTIVFNRYVPSARTRIAPLHRAEAVRRILSDSQDAVVIGPESLRTAAQLVRSARCLQVTSSDAVDAARYILDAHQPPVVPGVVQEIAAVAGHESPGRSADVVSVVVDGRAVLYTPEPHRVIELDEHQTAWWLLLDGTAIDQIVDEMAQATRAALDDVAATANGHVETFRALGVLGDAELLLPA